jgi:hypothetical protein
MKMKTNLIILALSLIALSCSSPMRKRHHDKVTQQLSNESMSPMMKICEAWPLPSKNAALLMKEKYGLPQVVTQDMFIWESSGQFKRSVVTKEQLNHQFPMEHVDILTQTIDYKVPVNKIDDLAHFDGSLIIDRTKGEISARNETEEMNILELNLAHQIVQGKLSYEHARREYAKIAADYATGTSHSLLTQINFTPSSSTSDPDHSIQAQQLKSPRLHQSQPIERIEKIIEEEED